MFLSFQEYLEEKQITFGNKLYPKFNNVVIIAGGAGCFVGDTLVKTDKGYIKIKNIDDSFNVYTLNEETNDIELNKVLQLKTFNDIQEKLIELEFDNGEIVKCTESHEFYIDGSWIKAKDIENLVSKKIIEKEQVYDLVIENNHNYLITKSNIIVHNSGKGFTLSNLIGIEGWVFDVDKLKQLSIMSTKFAQTVKDQTGTDLKKMDMKDPHDVGRIHDILSSLYSIDKKFQKNEFTSVLTADPERKPNLIFDVTLSSSAKLESITRNIIDIGYSKENIHLVWVINDVEVAMKQNQERSRQVPEEILISTHEGAATTMKKILDMGDKLKKYLDGDIILAFNKRGEDATIQKSELSKDSKVFPNRDSKFNTGGSYVSDANYVYVKRKGKPQLHSNNLPPEIYNKIMSYVPKVNTW